MKANSHQKRRVEGDQDHPVPRSFLYFCILYKILSTSLTDCS